MTLTSGILTFPEVKVSNLQHSLNLCSFYKGEAEFALVVCFRRANLVDQMIYMLEKHSAHLEELVQDRTKQLADEQKKTDELLSRMLPKYEHSNYCLLMMLKL